MLDNREVAAFTWLLLVTFWAVSRSDVRSSLRSVGRAALHPKILASLVGLWLWSAGLVVGGYRLGIWSPNLIKDTLIWVLGPGVALLFGLADFRGDHHFFRRAAVATIRLSVVLAFFLNFYVFPLLLEFLLQPLIAGLVILSVVAERQPEHRRAKNLVDGALGMLGLALLTFAGYRALREPGSLANWETTRQFLLPVWLTLGSLPFVFVVSVMTSYEEAFAQLRIASPRTGSRWRAKLALAVKLHLRIKHVLAFGGYWANQAAKAESIGAAFRVINRFMQDRAEAARQEEERVRRLESCAGVEGTNEFGREFDQREFEETRRALQALATAQMGWHRNRGGRYRPELLGILATRFDREGLPSDHGIRLRVSDDGQKWFAWRRTVTGRCFAVGAADPPPDQWLFDGAEPPGGFPGEDPSWDERRDGDVAPNW